VTPNAVPVEILLVEDDPGDVLIAREAVESSKVANHLNVVSNGEEALQYLRREAPFADASRPGLILLDLNLPRLDGREVLARVKEDPELRRIPVVVLTTSSSQDDVMRSYDLHANAFVTKPVDFDEFTTVVRQIDDFFVSIATLPHS
jgi:CheY-like chemotaxis protein